MREDDASRHTSDPLPLAVMVQPDPMLEERPAGPLRLMAVGLGAALIVTLALSGMTRPAGEPQVAAAPESQGPATTVQGAGEPAGQPDQGAQNQPKNQPGVQTGPSKTPPAAGNSATSAVGPGARPAPEAK
jgi:hypothetical protein